MSDRSVNFNAVSPGFFATLGVRLLAGRDFDQSDSRPAGEIGVRLALGATRASALRLVLRDAVTMIAAGVALALPCVAALGKLVQSQLFGVTATDPATIAAAAMVLAAGALAAAFIPAWRASNVSPTDALRLE